MYACWFNCDNYLLSYRQGWREMSKMKNISEDTGTSLSRTVFVGRMAAGVLLLNLFVIALVGLSLSRSRHHYEERAAIETRNLAQVLEQHVDGIIDKTDVVLYAATEEFEHQFARGGVDWRELKEFLVRMDSQLPELDCLTVTDARGRVIYHTNPGAGTLKDVSDREYFRHLRTTRQTGLYISKPIRSRISGKWVLVLARRIQKPDVNFAGTVCGALSLDYLHQFFSSINVGANGAIVLRDGTMGIIAGYPEPAGTGSTIGQKEISGEMTSLLRAGKDKGTFRTTPPIDNIERTYSFRKLTAYPLNIIVGLASSDYLKEWHAKVAKMTGAVLLFLMVTLISSWLVYIGWRSRNAVILTLREQEVKYRTVADYTYDWEYWIGPDGAFRYISPACKRITGYDADQFYEDPDLFNRLLHREDRKLYAAHRCEETPGTDSLVFRIVLRDGEVRWLEHSCQPIVDDAGTYLGNRCCNRDITERKEMEDDLLLTKFCVDNAAIGIFKLSEEGTILDVNEHACRSLGYSKQELLSVHVTQIDPTISAEKATVLREAMSKDGHVTHESLHRRRDGTDIPVEITTNVIEFRGKKYPFSFVKDISERKVAEQELAKIHLYSRQIIESVDEGVIVLDTDARFRVWNPHMYRLTGLSRDEVAGRRPGEVFPFLRDTGVDARIEHALSGQTSTSVDIPYHYPVSGRSGWLLETNTPLRDLDGEITGVIVTVRDITERKRVEQSLWETQFSVDHASIPIFWIGEGGKFFYVNRACSYLGYSREELLEMSVNDIDPDITEEESAEIIRLMKEKGSCTFQRRHRTRDNLLLPVEVTLQDLNMKVDGKEFHVTYVRDLSERKAAEAEIARSEEKFRAIFESARDAIFLIAGDSCYIDCNPAATELFGCVKEDLLARNPQYFSPPSQPDGRDTAQKAGELIRAAMDGTPQDFEWRHRRPDGSEFDAMVVLSRFELDNAPMLLAIVRDISQKKSLENQLYHAQKMESIGTLAGGVAHDFNNLLTVITGYGFMINTRLAPNDPQKAMIEQILSATDRAAQLTRGLLAFSRKQALDPKPVELNDIVKRVEKLLTHVIGADVQFVTRLSEKPLRLFADAGQLEQVLMNLVMNARDALPGGGSLIISTEEKREEHYTFHGLIKPGRYALIKVSDTGCGMDEQTRAKIFEPFFTTKELGKGTGLGLAIVYGIVKQHNGFINVYSEPEKGTTFKIHLPLISEMIAETDREAEPAPRGGTETILLTEDDPIIRTMAGSFLRDFGYRVIAAVDGEDALEKFADHEREIDLLILDVMMPKKDGGEVYKAVKAHRPDLGVLFISGYAADILRQKGNLEEGIQFISKPVSPADLLGKIREILDPPA